MKRIFLIVVLLLSFELSKESDSIKNNLMVMTKCFLNTKSNRDIMISIVEKIFTFKSLDEIIFPILNLVRLIKDCTGKDLTSLISKFIFKNEPKISEVLKRIKNFNAPILLRKYLHDFISKNGLENAKNECLSLIREKPFVEYNKICSIL